MLRWRSIWARCSVSAHIDLPYTAYGARLKPLSISFITVGLAMSPHVASAQQVPNDARIFVTEFYHWYDSVYRHVGNGIPYYRVLSLRSQALSLELAAGLR